MSIVARSVAAAFVAVLVATVPSLAQSSARGRAETHQAAGGRAATAGKGVRALDDAERALSAGDDARALMLAEQYLRTHSRSARAHVLLARIFVAREEFDAAYQRVRQALAADPKNVDALYFLGFVSGRLAGAELQRLTEMAPDSARAQQIAAETAVAEDRRADAEAAYEAALRAEPNLVDALLGLGRLKRMRLACTDAIALYERAEAIRPTFDGAYGLAVCLDYEHQAERSMAQYRTALERDPRSAVAWVGLAKVELKGRRAAQAIECAERAVSIEPAMGEGYYVLGRAYQLAGDAARAKEAFARAEQLRLDPAAAPARADGPSPATESPR